MLAMAFTTCFLLAVSAAKVRLGPSRRMLHGNGDRGVWLERHRQTENRMPLLNRSYLRVYLNCKIPTRVANPPVRIDPNALVRCAYLPCFVSEFKAAVPHSIR